MYVAGKHLPWIGTGPVKLVNECQTRHVISAHLPVHCDALTLQAAHACIRMQEVSHAPHIPKRKWLACRIKWHSNSPVPVIPYDKTVRCHDVMLRLYN